MNINGNEYSFVSIKLRLFGKVINSFIGVKFSDSIDGREPVYETGPLPAGRTRGRYKVGDCSLTWPLSGWQEFLRNAPSGYGELEGEITIQFAEGSDIHTVTLEDVRLGGADETEKEGTDRSEVETSLSVLRICRDGKYLMEPTAP